jgi:hypothetical protein
MLLANVIFIVFIPCYTNNLSVLKFPPGSSVFIVLDHPPLMFKCNKYSVFHSITVTHPEYVLNGTQKNVFVN